MGDGYTGQNTQPLTNSIKVLKEHKEHTNNTNTISAHRYTKTQQVP